MDKTEVHEAMRNLIRGTGVRRGTHPLTLDGADVTTLFLELLCEEGFQLLAVEEIAIEPGQRVPAFYVEAGVAHFGWVFWEVFFPGRMRKIFGSAKRNAKGDWAIMLGRKQKVYVNLSLREVMDLDRPSEF